MNYKSYILLLLIIASSMTSCMEDAAGGLAVKPSALGRLNEIVAIADEDLWDSPVKDTFEFYFESAYPILPAPEPMFDIRHFSPRELNAEELRKELRTYVMLADLSEKDTEMTKMIRTDIGEERYRKALAGELKTIVVKDKWARGQLLIYLMGVDKKALYQVIQESYPAVSRRINLHDAVPLKARVYASGENLGLTERVAERFNLSMPIPRMYEIAMDNEEDDFLWLIYRDPKIDRNIVIRSIPYKNTAQFSKESIMNLRDEFGKYVTSSEPGSYMVINKDDLPVFEYTYEIDGSFTKELRGIWEMTGDFIGGPFVSYIIHDESSQKIIYIDTFVYAPGEDKRDLMQELDYMVKNANVKKLG